MYGSEDPSVLQRVAAELESLRNVPTHDGVAFPRNCGTLLRSMNGNSSCVDCGNRNPDWASVTYGVLLCVRCSGRHRSYGVATSRVRSISMDAWSHSQVLALLEGGNEQMQHFFQRHQMGNDSSASNHRYQTKAARFYKIHLEKHVDKVASVGLYKGREASRRKRHANRKPDETTKAQENHARRSTQLRDENVVSPIRVDYRATAIAV
jgi:hypothetical protein